jgi:peptidoglycan/xylan/chitin deacetylase (PgdA/CDA1 family)
MKLAHLGAIATAILVAVGVVLAIGPAYMHTLDQNKPPPVMLSFSIVDSQNVPQWCKDISSILAKYNVKATVFITGKIAENNPDCVKAFASYRGIDIGSQTYSYVSLPTVGDYTKALDEVKRGKLAVDTAGNLNSKIFKAPYDATDQNIYSLLSGSNITADFSYQSQYNRYDGNQFVKYNIVSCQCIQSPDKVHQLANAHLPVVIDIDNKTEPTKIGDFIATLKNDHMNLVNASDLTGLDLTIRTT